MTNDITPSDFMINAQGHYVPRSVVSDIDIARDDLVREIVKRAHALQDAMVGFKSQAMGDVSAFIDMSAEQYGAVIGGEKGNATLSSFDGKYKVERANQDYFTFDERLQVAKSLVDECLVRWSEGARPEIRATVMHAFQVDQAGRVNRARLLSLTKLEIDDEKWRQAMKAIFDAQQVVGSKSYLRVFERSSATAKWRPITLDLAAL